MKKLIFSVLLSALLIGSATLYSCSKEEHVQITVASEAGSEYILVRPDESSKELWKAGGVIHKSINDACGEDTVEYTTDWVNRGETVPTDTKEILFGNTNRSESADAMLLLPNRANNMYDFVIKAYDGRIAIVGGSDAALENAAAYFCSNFIDVGTVKIPGDFEYIYKYPFPEIVIGDTPISQFTVLYQSNNNYLYKQCADRFNEQLDKLVGFTLPVDSDKAKEKYEHIIYLKYAPTLEYNAVVTADGNLEISGVPESVEYAVSDYSELLKHFSGSNTFETDKNIASEKYTYSLASSALKKQPAINGSSEEHGRRAYSYHIIDDDTIKHWSGLMSSWDYDGRGREDKISYYFSTPTVNDASATEPVYLTRQITPQSEGIITFEAKFNCSNDGAVIELCNKKGDHALYMEYVNGKLCVKTGNETKELVTKAPLDQYLKVNCSFVDNTNEIIYNGKSLGTFAFSDECEYIEMIRFGVTPEKTGNMIPEIVKMYANYLVNERFIAPAETIDCDIDIFYTGGTCAVMPNAGMNSGNADRNSLEVNAEYFELTKNFEKTSGKVIFEGKFILPQRTDGLTFALTKDRKQIIAMKTENFGIFTGDRVLLRNYYSENVWHTLRIEADTKTGKAVMKMNGKVLDEVYFEDTAEYFDGISISYDGENPAHFWLDEIYCFADPQFDDYVPEPVISDDKNYVVGINICSLWREGTHSGWDKISAYDEIKPLLGFYDEGVPEVQDWEIKWMTEHGIDFQLFCWYASSPNVPMMHTHLNDALMSGYMNAKYSDKMKFALLWECANAARPQNSDDFRSNFIPYWVEHYLSDERYMSIDGNAVLAIFGADKLINDLGGTDACKAELDYFRDICRDLDYEGAIIMACSSSQDQGSLAWLKSAGFDAVYAYNWGKSGFDTTHTENVIRRQMNYNAIHVVPTLSTGFNNVGWAGTRSPNMTVEDFDGMLSLFKNSLLKNYSTKTEDWKEEFIMLSTWNEYGEGTYIIPSGLNGFGYIDAVRNHYGEETVEHNDIIPTESQLSRFTQMYSPERNTLEPLYKKTPEFRGEKLIGFDFENSAKDRISWEAFFGISSIKDTGSSLDGTSNASDFAIKPVDIKKCNINLDDVAYIKVKMKVNKNSTASFYFLTENDHQWNANKGLSTNIKATDTYEEYIFDARNLQTWTGRLDDIRFDVIEGSGSFSIKSIEFYLNEPARLYLNGNKIDSVYGYEKIGNNIYSTINPQAGIPGKLGISYRWDKETKSITLYNANASITYTIGSDKAITNVVDVYGFETDASTHKEITLSRAVGEIDGLPVICINELADIFGIEYSYVDDTYIDLKIE